MAQGFAGKWEITLSERIGISNGIFAPAPGERAPWPTPASPARGRAVLTGFAAPLPALRQPRQSSPQHGAARQSAAWTCRAGWDRVGPSGVPWGDGRGTGGGTGQKARRGEAERAP